MINQSETPILVQGVSKRFDTFNAVDNISFAVPRGSIFGLLGPNGAGKTTTIRMIMNIIVPDSGSITVLGEPSTKAAAKKIGYLPEERGLYRKMKVIDHLEFLGEIRGVERAAARKRADGWLDRLELTSWRTKKVEELSKGMQQKLQFIACVLHEPEILILDEPFSGLDPVNARVVKDLLLEFRAEGRTLVVSTHVMEQAEKLCDAIALINRAKIVLEGSMTEIKKRFSGNRVVIRGEGDLSALGTIRGVLGVTPRDGALDVDLVEGLSRSEFLHAATEVCSIASVVPHEASLDEIFVTVVRPEALASSAVGGDS